MGAMQKLSVLLVLGTLGGAVWPQDSAPAEIAPTEAEGASQQTSDVGDTEAPGGDDAEPFVPPPDVYPHPIERDSDRQPRLVTGGNVLIVGATVHDALAPGRLADVLVVDGKIAAIGEDLIPPEGTLTVEGAGKHLAPGVVDAHSHMAISGGVNEGSVSISAEVDMEDVIDADDPALYRALAGGCTTIQVLHGSANAIGGQAALLKLRRGSTDDELVFRGAPKGIKFALGENPKRSNWGTPGERFPSSRLGVEALFHRAFERAREYRAELELYGQAIARGETPLAPRRDLRLEALVAILEGDLVVHAHSYRADEILMLLRVAEQYGFKVGVLHHVLEGYKVAREIAEHGAGTSTFSDWWAFKIEAYDAVPGNAELLDRAGVLSGIKSDSDELVRHLYHEAAKSVGYSGLDRVRALRLVTLHPAQQLGVGDRVGSIEVGKDADLVLLDADPLSVHSKVLMTLVDGEVEFERRDAFELDYARANLVRPEFSEPPAPVSPEGPVVAIVGATLHTVEQGIIENGTLLIQGGRIAALGGSVAVPDGAETVDASGKHLFPGLVALDTTLGLREIDSIRATLDTSEDGGNQPDVRVSASLHADSAHIGVTRERGITVAQSAPRGRGPLLGQSAVLALDGDTWEELLLVDRDMLHVRVPGVPNTSEPRRGRARGGADASTSDKELANLELAFEAAVQYERLVRERTADGDHQPPFDSRLAALVPYATGQKTVALYAQNAATLLRAVEFAAKTKVRAVIYGAAEGWKVADAIASAGIPVVVGPVAALPTSEYDPYDSPYANAAVLSRAGVRVAIGAGNDDNPRNLGFHAGFAAAYGLTPAAALEAVTLAPARILGMEAQLGSLAVGKRTDLVLADGDILEPTTRILNLWIAGKPVDLDSKQTRLYKRYQERYESGGGR
ncbi:MAG: amidohydrolase family protein [Planctomycetaceae bacterium]|nr:amidohydrolase family protein [Planctomycetaceae bacterium]